MIPIIDLFRDRMKNLQIENLLWDTCKASDETFLVNLITEYVIFCWNLNFGRANRSKGIIPNFFSFNLPLQ